MKFTILTSLTLATVTLVLPQPRTLSAQDPAGGDARPERDVSKLTDEEKAEIAMRYQAASQPGELHEMLMSHAGDCSVEVHFSQGMAGQAMTIKGQGTREAVLDGRYLMSKTKVGMGPMQVETLTMLGYDRRSEEFTLQQYDTMGTYSISARGPYDAETRTAKMSGTEWDPITQATQIYDIILTFSDGGTSLSYVFHDEAHTKGGEPVEYMRVVLTNAE